MWIKCAKQIFIKSAIIQIKCQLHINPKREKEPNRTVFWFAVNPKPVATPFCVVVAKAEASCQPSKSMLAKKKRIGKEFFSVCFPDSRRFNSPHLTLTVVKSKNWTNGQSEEVSNGRAQRTDNVGTGTPSRFAFSVSKKVCKLAVDRNRLRRQGYSIVGKHLAEIPDGFLFFFSFKKATYPVSSVELEKEICGLLSIKTQSV
jgi:ribonuclease P protein component